MEAHFGDTQQARADADAALRVVVVGSNPQFPWVAMALALSGDVKRAEKLATELDKRFPLNTVVQHYWLPTIRAAVALTRKDAKKAVELLSAITPYELGALWLIPIYERGRAYLMLHDGSAAAAEFQKIIDHPETAMRNGHAEILRLGVFEVAVRAGEVRKQGVRIKLQEQPFQFLTILLQRPGGVVTREELRSAIWQSDTFVDFDNGLNTNTIPRLVSITLSPVTILPVSDASFLPTLSAA